jgi:hypothetical protein
MLRVLALLLTGLLLSSCATFIGPKFYVVTDSGTSVECFDNFYKRGKEYSYGDIFLGSKLEWEY